MDKYTFIANVIKALAWPGTVLVITLLLRRHLLALLPRLRNLKYKELQADFAEELAVADRASSAVSLPRANESSAESSPARRIGLSDSITAGFAVALAPATAIDSAWRRLLQAMEDALRREGVTEGLTEKSIERELIGRGLLPDDALTFVRSLRNARDQAVRLGDLGIDHTQAAEFVRLANRLIVALDSPSLPKE